MINHVLNILSFEMIVLGVIVGALLMFFAIRWSASCFLLGFPVLLFLGQVKDFFPASVSASAAIFPIIAVIGQIFRGHRFTFNRCEKSLIVLALLMVCSVSYSSYPVYGLDKAILFCFMVVPIIIFAPQVINGVRSLRIAVSIISMSFIVYVFWSALLLGGLEAIEGRMAFLSDVIRAGQFFGAASIVSLVHVAYGKRTIANVFFYGCLMATSLFLLFVTGTRAALLGVVLTMMFIYWFAYIDWFQRIVNKAGKTYAIIFFAIIFISTGVFFLKQTLPQQSIVRFASIENFFSNFSPSELKNWQESKSRALNYFSAIEGFCSHPLGGVGAGGYGSVMNKYRNIQLYNYRGEIVHFYPHNMVLEFAVEQGVFGLFLILYVLYINFKMILFLRRYVHKEPEHRSLVVFCVSIYVYGLLVSMTSLDIPRMMILWWGMGLLLATERIYNLQRSFCSERLKVEVNNQYFLQGIE